MKNINASVTQGLAPSAMDEFSTSEGSLDMALLFRQAALLNLHFDLKRAIGRPGKPLCADSLRKQVEKAIALDLELRAVFARHTVDKTNAATVETGPLSGQSLVSPVLISER